MTQRFSRLLIKLCLLVVVLGLLAFGGAVLTSRYVFQEPAQLTWSRYAMPEFLRQRQQYPSIRWAFDLAEPLFRHEDPRHHFTQPQDDPAAGFMLTEGAPVGPRAGGLGKKDTTGPVSVAVASAEELHRAVARAEPGMVIEIQPGTYEFTGTNISIDRPGTPARRIVVRAAKLGSVRLKFALLEGFHVIAPYWTFENLMIEGICRRDSRCEHAFHVVGDGKSVVIRNNWVRNFNASVKVNAKAGRFPDDGLILHNAFVNDRPRNTDNPVTLLDIVAVSRWRIQGNVIADFAKAEGNNTSYAAFFKGAGEDNIFEQNLVRCEWRHSGGARIGFSYGDGGTAHRHCRDKRCTVQHRRGIIRNNVIMNCPNAPGIYLNRSAETRIHNNALINTRGIDVRRVESDADIVNNIVDGRILSREGGSYTAADNLRSDLKAVLLDKLSDDIYLDARGGDLRLSDPGSIAGAGQPLAEAGLDFCGRPYDAAAVDVGPIQYRGETACAAALP